MLIGMAAANIRRLHLGRILAGHRKAAGFNQEAAGVHVERSQSFIAQVETGKLGIRGPDLERMLRRYGVAESVANELLDFNQEAGKRGWWSVLPDWFGDWIGLEHDARTARALELELIPGLLQTEAYAREQHVLRGALSDAEVEERVSARMQRQARLSDPYRPLEYFPVVSESALQWCAGEADPIGADQLRHLLRVARLPNVHLRVLAYRLGRHSGMQGSYTLLGFSRDLLPDVAWQEHATGGHVIDDPAEVESLSSLFDRVSGQALDEERSVALIADLAGVSP